MTVTSATRRAGPFYGNGSATAFPFDFKVFAATDLEVTVTDADGVETVITTGFTVALNADQDSDPGGTITYEPGGSPMAVGESLVAVGDLDYTQETDLTNAGRFLPQALENALDRQAMLSQQLLELNGRQLVIPATGPFPVTELPAQAAREDRLLAFDPTTGQPAASDFTQTQVASAIAAAYSGASGPLDALSFIQAGTGATSRTAQAKARERVTPEDFGATGNGIADDTAELTNHLAASEAPQFSAGKTYLTTSVLTYGAQSLLGEKSTIQGPGIVIDDGGHFYDYTIHGMVLDGTGTSDATGLKIVQGHRGVFTQVACTNFTGGTLGQGFQMVDAYLNTFLGLRVQGNDYGALIEENSNANTFVGSSFNTSGGHGAYVRGSYSVKFYGCDFEGCQNGIILSNTVGAGAEPRVNSVHGGYFEGNTDNDVWIGDQATADRIRQATVQDCYFQGGTVVGIRVDRSDSAILRDNYFVGSYSTSKIFLRANSRNTTITPFPRRDLAIDTEITVEAGATVSPQTRQWGRATMALDGSGSGFADITFKAPYEEIVPINVTFYIEDDADAGVNEPIAWRLTNVDEAGFRLRVIASSDWASDTVNYTWVAGA